MNRADQIFLSSVQALEKGFVATNGGWNREKAAALLDAMKAHARPVLPISTQTDEVFIAILDILSSLEEAEPRYVPMWAKELLAG